MEITSEGCFILNRKIAKIKAFLPLFLALFIGAFLFAFSSAKAQEADVDPSSSIEQTIVDQATSEPSTQSEGSDSADENTSDENSEENISQEAIQDFDITIEDMGANRATIMPDSPLHVFKRFGHAFTEVITFDPVAKAELRLEHANDYLAETKQMIEEQGMENVNHDAVTNAIGRYEEKVFQIKGQISDVKAKKSSKPEQVEIFLDDFVDKQLKQHKVLDKITDDVVQVKKQRKQAGEAVDATIEQVVAKVEDAKGGVITSFADVLSGIEDTPEDMATRLSSVMDNQSGSDFKHLKNLEVLEAVYDKVPQTAKEAINQARENTKKKFEVKINSLPPAVRAEKFQNYVEQATVDETRLVTLLDELKQSTGIPADILAKLEEAKEIAVRKFEEKLNYIDDVSVEQRYFDRFNSTEVDGLIAMEEFTNRMTKESDIGKKMKQAHNDSVNAFKKIFKDVDSQYQAERFQALTEEMTRNPNPKTFKLLKELEAEVMADPQKKAFLEQTEAAMKNQFETKFRRDGDRFMDRISSLDPNDIGILEGFDFGEEFNARFVEKNTEQFQNYMQSMDMPEHFDIFRDRFSQAPEFVINEIKTRDVGFQDAMMFKMRKMEETRSERERDIVRASLDYEEREVNFQMDRLQRQKEEEFQKKLNEIPWDDFATRKSLWEGKINEQYSLVEQRFNEQKRIFEGRIASDPFCDASCKAIQVQFMEQQLRHEKERMSDDLVRERNRIEREKQQNNQNRQADPLYGKCDSPDSCDAYCREHSGEPGCEWAINTANIQACPPPGWWDFGMKRCVFPEDMGPPQDFMYDDNFGNRIEFTNFAGQCQPGEIWISNHCERDPYYRPPERFQQCPFGQHWNDMRGFCEQDKVQCKTFAPVRDCAQGEKPVPPDPKDSCGQPSCIVKTQFCPDLNASMPAACPEGQYREIVSGANNCPKWGPCSQGQSGPPDAQCPKTYEPICGTNGKTYDNECQAKAYGIGVQFYGGCESSGFHDCAWGQFWSPEINKCLKETDYVPFRTPGKCDYGWKWTGEYCARDAGIVGACQPRCEPQCSNGSFCVFDDKGCAKECSPTCGQGEYYDQWQGACVKSYAPKPGGWCGDRICDPAEKTAGNCAEDCGGPVYGDCGNNSAESSCFSQPGCMWQRDPSGAGYCVGDDYRGGGYCGDGSCGNGETMQSCASDCGSNMMPCDYDGICEQNMGEGVGSCPSDCKGTTPTTTDPNMYAGDANSCPGFAYSKWDSSGKRYCQLNETRSCSRNYPDYLTRETYKPEYCPSETSTPPSAGTCESNTTIDSCQDSSCVWCSGSSTCKLQQSYCDDSAASGYCGDGMCNSGESDSSCPEDCYTQVSCTPVQANGFTASTDCNFGACASGCNFDSNGCPTGCKTSGGMCTKNIYNNYEGSKNCNWNQCENGCVFNASGCPTSCASTAAVCGDGTCASSETQNTCPADCGGYCGDGSCSATESSSSCPSDCDAATPPSTSGSCGDRVCSGSETSSSCPADCGTSSTETCGNGFCGLGETMTSCPADCGGSSGYCDGICGNGESSASCPGDCGGTSGGSAYAGDANSCPGFAYSMYDQNGARYCRLNSSASCQYNYPDYLTESNYSSSNCPADSSTWDSSGTMYCNNNGICDYNQGEGMGSCPSDCSSDSSMTACNNNGTCESGESSGSCPSDCGGAADGGYMSCNNWVSIGSACDPSAGTCCSNGMCSNMYGPGTCEDAGGYMPPEGDMGAWCGDGTCSSDESSDWCPSDCGAVQGASTKRDLVSKYNPFNLLKPFASFFSDSN